MVHCCKQHASAPAAMSGSYTCPMHPEVIQEGPGDCPICSMSLEPKQPLADVVDAEYDAMRHRFWLAALLTLPVLILASGQMLPSVFMIQKIPYQASLWLQFALSTPVVFWAGRPLLQKAWQAWRHHRSTNMFTLIALGVGAAYFYSTAALLIPDVFPEAFRENGKLFVYFEAAAVITVLVLLGQMLELKATSQTNQAVQALLRRVAKVAHRMEQGQEQDIPIEKVSVGDLLGVKPGETIPVDGNVVDGSSYVDESMITGEFLPVGKTPGSQVISGTLNQNGYFVMQAQKVGHDTLLARIIARVAEAQRSKAPIQKLADKFSAYFVPGVMVCALFTFLTWAWIGPEPRYAYALLNAIAVLIIACPCALGLATPMSIRVGVGRGAEMGILIKNAEALEILGKVKTLLIDKTGTLTEGKPQVIQVVSSENGQEDALLQIAAAVERKSEHPLGSAIVLEAQRRKLAIPEVLQFESFTGQGVAGRVNGKLVWVGNASWMKKNRIEGLADLLTQSEKAQAQAYTIIFAAFDGQAMGYIAIADPVKASSPKAMEDLHRLGLKVIMLTGDNAHSAQAVATKLHIDQFHANLGPEDKIDWVQKYKSEENRVAMAGDGINDAPALAAADVGIAMGTGTDAAIESAGVTLIKGDLRGIEKSIALSQATLKNIRQNLFFAFVYNAAGIPLAAGVLYPFTGWLLNPMFASAAMALSSLMVIMNALRLRKISG